MINFRAQKVQTTNILYRKRDDLHCNKKAYIAKLDVESLRDLSTLNKLHQKWYKQDIVKDILSSFKALREGRSFNDIEDYFILTTQQYNFEHLDENSILGIAQVNKMDFNAKNIKIENLQVNPTSKYGALIRNYEYVGTALVKFIKSYYNEKEIYLYAKKSAIPFYEKQGFKRFGNSIKMIFLR